MFALKICLVSFLLVLYMLSAKYFIIYKKTAVLNIINIMFYSSSNTSLHDIVIFILLPSLFIYVVIYSILTLIINVIYQLPYMVITSRKHCATIKYPALCNIHITPKVSIVL